MLDQYFAVDVEILNDDARSACDGGQGIIGASHGDLQGFRKTISDTEVKRATTHQDNAFVHHVGKYFRWSGLEHFFSRVDQNLYRRCERLANVGVGHDDLARESGQKIAPADGGFKRRFRFRRGTNGNFDVLRSPLPDQYLEFIANIGNDVAVETITRNFEILRIDDTAERYHGNIGSASADIYHHRTDRIHHGKANAYRRGHWFLNDKHFACSGIHRRIAHRARFNIRNGRRHADDDTRTASFLRQLLRLINEVREHLFRYLKVRDHSVNQAANGNDMPRRAPEHLLRVCTHRDDAIGLLVKGDNGRLIDDDSVVAKIHKGIRGPQVYADIPPAHHRVIEARKHN